MKPRVLIVSKFYYHRGGAEVVAINMANDLTYRGYDIGIFTMDYEKNIPYKNLYTTSEVNFSRNLPSKLKFAARTLGIDNIKKDFCNALDAFKPEIVHLHNIHSYLSPIIAKLAKQRGCKVIWTLHDYKLMCPSYNCLNNGNVCEKCFSNKRNVLINKCIKDSFSASLLAYFESLIYNKRWIQKYVDYFICPSEFIASKMVQCGYNKDTIKVICNFIDPTKLSTINTTPVRNRGDYYTYVGRLSVEKGVQTLLEAAKQLPFKLKIAGIGPLKSTFEKQYSGYKNIEFLGHLSPSDVITLLTKSKASVIPSEWYENNPLSVIESLCAGTPVIGANIGGIPELISPATGILFESKNISQLQNAIDQAMTTSSFEYQTIASESKIRFSFEKHFEMLKELYI